MGHLNTTPVCITRGNEQNGKFVISNIQATFVNGQYTKAHWTKDLILVPVYDRFLFTKSDIFDLLRHFLENVGPIEFQVSINENGDSVSIPSQDSISDAVEKYLKNEINVTN